MDIKNKNALIKTDKIYRGCRLYYKDGTLAVISKSGGCSTPISRPFWQDLVDVNDQVKIKKLIEDTKTSQRTTYNDLFRRINK